jgi:hypothetical protein
MVSRSSAPGDEVLTGKIVNVNFGYIGARRCAALTTLVKRVATSAPMPFVATMVDFRFVGL